MGNTTLTLEYHSSNIIFYNGRKCWNIVECHKISDTLKIFNVNGEPLRDQYIYLSKKKTEGLFHIVSNYLHRKKVQDIKELFNLATNKMMGTKDGGFQADKVKLLIRHIFFSCRVNIH